MTIFDSTTDKCEKCGHPQNAFNPGKCHVVPSDHGFIGTSEQLVSALYECGDRNGAIASAICKTAADLIRDIPKDWQLVPVAATETMEAAAVKCVAPYHDQNWFWIMPKDLFRLGWKAMLAASPRFPTR